MRVKDDGESERRQSDSQDGSDTEQRRLKSTNSPLTGVMAADPARPSSVPLSPEAARLKSLNPLRVKSAALEWRGSVRGRKCLQRQDLMFKRIWLRSDGVREDDDDDGGGKWEGRWEEPVRSEVLVCEVLVPEWRSGGLLASSSGSGSESGQMGSAVCALSSNTLHGRREHQREGGQQLNHMAMLQV